MIAVLFKSININMDFLLLSHRTELQKLIVHLKSYLSKTKILIQLQLNHNFML